MQPKLHCGLSALSRVFKSYRMNSDVAGCSQDVVLKTSTKRSNILTNLTFYREEDYRSSMTYFVFSVLQESSKNKKIFRETGDYFHITNRLETGNQLQKIKIARTFQHAGDLSNPRFHLGFL